MIPLRRNHSGFTLIEVVTAILLLSILLIAATNFLFYTSDRYRRFTVRNELLHSAKLTMEFLINECNNGEYLKVERYQGTEVLYTLSSTVGTATHVIYFDNTKNTRDEYYQTVRFGGFKDADGRLQTQVLAKYIDAISVRLDPQKDILYITVKTTDTIDNTSITPLTLYGEANLYDKPYDIY